MSNHFKIPLISPFKFVPSTATPNVVSDFDGSWACEQIKSFEQRAYYKQKWIKSKTTKLQIESSLAPDDLKIYNNLGKQVKAITWTAAYTGIGYTIWEVTFDISDLAEGVYYIYQKVAFGAISWPTISEPIWSKASWPLTLSITYKNSFNDFDVAWTTGIEMTFTVEAAIMEMTPRRERTDYVNQEQDVTTLKGTPFREFTLYVGKAEGVAPWVGDLLNRIFCCDYINIEGKLYQAKSGQECKVTRVKNYPLIGWSQDIAEAQNLQSLEFADTTPFGAGIVTAYELETDFFGPAGTGVQITEIEENS